MAVTGGDRQERARPPLPHGVPVGPHDVNLQLLVDEAFESVIARQDVSAQMVDLRDPPNLKQVITDEFNVIKLNITDQLERTRQVGNRLHDLLAAEASKDTRRLEDLSRLIEIFNQLQDAQDALLEIRFSPSIERLDLDHVQAVLDTARDRSTAADSLIVEAKRIRGSLKSSKKGFEQPGQPIGLRDAVDFELLRITEQLDKIEKKIKVRLRNQRPAARENLEFRALENEWHSARNDLTAAAESIIHGLVRTALNKAVSAQYSLSMNIGSLDGLRETITNEKIVITTSFTRLESVIGRRGEGSFGIAGPRGVGKSTLIKFFTALAAPLKEFESESRESTHRPRLGATVSAPVAYDPRDFMLHLHSEVCRTVLGPDADWEPDSAWSEVPQRRAKSAAGLGIALFGTLGLVGGAILLDSAAPLVTAPNRWWSHLGLALTGLSVVFLVLFLVGIAKVTDPRKSWNSHEIPHLEWQFTELAIRAHSASRSFLYCLALAICAAIGLPLVTAPEGLGRGAWWLLGGVAAVSVGLVLLFTAWSIVRFNAESIKFPTSGSFGPVKISTLGGLREMARDQLRQIRYEQTLNSERSTVVKLGGMRQLPIGVDLGTKQGATMAERVKTYPEIIASLRSFIESVTKVQDLVIAIDELDKLKDAASVENFLNDIKAVFGPSRCFFLVSVSEEAAASFERRGVPFRDVFDSSFDDVVTLDRLTMDEARKILYSLLLGWTEPFVAFCYVLSGGLPRELHRSVREVVGWHSENSDVDLVEAVPQLMQKETAGRLWAARHSLQRDSADPTALILLDQIESIQPQQATADHFRKWYEELRSWATREGSLTPHSGGPSHICATARLGCELASSMLFAETVIEFFNGTLDAGRLRQAEMQAAGDRSITHLAEARHTLSLNPWSAAASIARFRKAWEM
ncbi:hypothetical protein ACWCQQ_30565 [Streptomyces sp. NPDC002143]